MSVLETTACQSWRLDSQYFTASWA